MTTTFGQLRSHSDQLMEQLKQIGEFRRGTINVFYRKCGKERCVCTKEGHPGHGPQTTLTFKEGSKTRSRNLPTAAAVELVAEQIRNHDRFMDWYKRWRQLNEQMSDRKLDEVLAEKKEEDTPEKKRRRRSSRRSGGRLSS